MFPIGLMLLAIDVPFLRGPVARMIGWVELGAVMSMITVRELIRRACAAPDDAVGKGQIGGARYCECRDAKDRHPGVHEQFRCDHRTVHYASLTAHRPEPLSPPLAYRDRNTEARRLPQHPSNRNGMASSLVNNRSRSAVLGLAAVHHGVEEPAVFRARLRGPGRLLLRRQALRLASRGGRVLRRWRNLRGPRRTSGYADRRTSPIGRQHRPEFSGCA